MAVASSRPAQRSIAARSPRSRASMNCAWSWLVRKCSVAARNYEPMYPYVGAAIIYLLLVMLFTWLLGIFERRLRASDRR